MTHLHNLPTPWCLRTQTIKDRWRARTRHVESLLIRSSVTPILEYAVQVWQDIPDYLSDRIQPFQNRALKIIYPNSSYSQALSQANESTLSNRPELLCHKFMSEMIDTRDHPLSCLVSTALQRTNPYNLRPGSSRPFNKFIDQRTIFTFKYSSLKYPP